ncbi:hypothetical protein ColKHC_03558 [Colletotrichum higginsianum]|nr:hypothetical protein ColKHC_03558 [Colletotrichum higginsianum]
MKFQQALALLIAFGEAVSAFPAAVDHATNKWHNMQAPVAVKTSKPGKTVEDYVGGFDVDPKKVEDYVGGFDVDPEV